MFLLSTGFIQHIYNDWIGLKDKLTGWHLCILLKMATQIPPLLTLRHMGKPFQLLQPELEMHTIYSDLLVPKDGMQLAKSYILCQFTSVY